ncbi:MAG: class I SAM-dependent methyltransferase [Chloroflexota bacterium]
MQAGEHVAPDGSPVVVYARLPPGEAEAEVISAAVPNGATILELGAGAGRVTRPLLDRGYRVTAVDNSPEMLAQIHGAETVEADIERLSLGRRFDAVVHGSHMVNTSDDAQRRAFLRTCRAHVSDHGIVLLEHHAATWLQTAEAGVGRQGEVAVALRDVRRHPPFVTAVAEYRVDGHVFSQSFTARVFTDDELARELRSVGLEVVGRPNPRWTIARRAPRPPAT